MSSQPLQSLLSRLVAVEKKWLKDVKKNPDNESFDIPGRKGPQYPATVALRSVCNVAEDAVGQGLDTNDLNAFLDVASKLENHIIEREYINADVGLDFIPVSCNNIVEDEGVGILGGMMGAGGLEQIMGFMSLLGKPDSTRSRDAMIDFQGTLKHSKTYDRAARPSEHTTPLTRFSKTRLQLPTNASPELTAFAEARCEILSDDMCLPISMGITDDIVVVIGAGGWKQRSPTLLIERLDRVSNGYAPFGTLHPRVGLAEVANELCLDSSRNLMYVADSSRVKSYAWNYDGEDGTTLPVHTLDSHGFEDALFLRNNGAKIMRSGTKGLAIWDIDGLPTHGEDGEDRVGKKLKNIDTMRDDDEAEEIERSSGAPPTQTLSAPPLTRIIAAKNHPSNQAQILAMHRSVLGRDYNVVSVDLETQQIAMRFLGHSASPSCIATNSTDPNGFVTAAFDGGVRLYDVRQPTPRLAIDHGDEKLCAALYESIGGQPFIIYGTDKSEQIKVWDVRSRKPMYELATGNTAVRTLAWDASRQTLLAATECIYRDRVGNVHDYRPAKIGSHGREWLGDGNAYGEHEGEDKDEDWEDEDEDSDEDDEDDEERWWPDRAWHAETSFGVALDCADHMLFRYQFKSDTDPKVLPEYGQAGASLADNYW